MSQAIMEYWCVMKEKIKCAGIRKKIITYLSLSEEINTFLATYTNQIILMLYKYEL